MKKFLLPLLVLLTTSFSSTLPATGQALSPTPPPSKTYCLPAAQVRVVDTALLQFEALKPIVVKLHDTNRELRLSGVALRVALQTADMGRAYADSSRVYQEKLTANAEANWQKYQAKSTARGWTIASLLAVLIGGLVVSVH